MSFVIYPTSLYKFLKIAKEQNVEKTVLDCGAGEKSIKEMLRVLKKDGLLYINFILNIEGRTNLGEEKDPGEFWMDIEGEDVIHSIYSDNEPDSYFKDTTIIFKEKRTFTVNNGSKHYTDGYIEYIIKK